MDQKLEKIISKEFGDVYYSDDDGLAEKKHVFFDQIQFEKIIAERSNVTIVEFGFGLGLNLYLCLETVIKSNADVKINYFTIEKHPLSKDLLYDFYIENKMRNEGLSGFLKSYGNFVDGLNNVTLTEKVGVDFYKGDVNGAMNELPNEVDVWFLDGFSPSLNPQMWTDEIFETMAKHSGVGAQFATYSAAGFVRRGLQEVGFLVEKKKGYGRKRDILSGIYQE